MKFEFQGRASFVDSFCHLCFMFVFVIPRYTDPHFQRKMFKEYIENKEQIHTAAGLVSYMTAGL